MVPQNLARWMHRVAALVLALLLPTLSVGDEPTTFDPYPLRPADTSSPRDTLRSFDEGVIRAYAAFKVGEPAHVLRESVEVSELSCLHGTPPSGPSYFLPNLPIGSLCESQSLCGM